MKSDLPTNQAYHPSFLALDRAHLAEASPAVSAHLTGCESCRGYVASLASDPVASGFVELEQTIQGRKKRVARWLWTGASLAAAACALLLVVRQRFPDTRPGGESYVGAKGFRSVWIYVKRGTETTLWDGKRRLLPGDRLRLKVDPGSYHQLAVYSAAPSPTLLFSGKLTPGQNLTLPEAWEIDDSPSDEQLLVVFSDAPVEPDWNDWRLGRVPPGIAVLPFTLPKTGSDAGSFGP
jgi:hypothetical protein